MLPLLEDAMTTKSQRDLVAKMKWPPCPIETVSVSGGYIPPGQPRVTGTKLPCAEQHFDDRVILSPERHADLVRKINLGIAALERLMGCDASYDLIEHDGVKHCVYCGREYLAADVDEKLCPSEDCPGFVCRAALKEMKK